MKQAIVTARASKHAANFTARASGRAAIVTARASGRAAIAETWWHGFLDGDLNGFAQLIDHHQADVFAVALATVLDRALAEDIAQETFITAFQRRAQLRDPSAVGGWLAAIARNLGRDLRRKRKREQLVELHELDVASDAEDPARTLDRAALSRDVQRVVGRVPARYREVLVLYYSHERSVRSIAQSLGLSEAATMQRLSRGRRLVRDHAGDLQQLAASRPRRSFTVAVLALLALRQTARAAGDRAMPRLRGRSIRRAGLIAGLVAVLGVVRSDRAAGNAGPSEIATPVVERRAEILPATARVVVTSDVAPTTVAAPVLHAPAPAPSKRFALSRPALPPRVPPPMRTAALDEPATCSVPGLPPPAPLAVDVAVTPCAVGCVPPASAPKVPLPYDQINGFLETAALPRARDVSYETIGMAMVLRAGVTRNVALHVGMTGMDTDRGTLKSNANPAFGGGVKIGGRLSKLGAVAVVAEGAREVNLKTMESKEGYLARAYAAVTLGTPKDNVTLIGGVISEFDGTNRWRSPLIGLASNIGWDDRLGLVVEGQHFTTPRDTLNAMCVVAVRFRFHHVEPSFLGIDRMRLDVGTVLLEHTDSDEVEALPWLQVGLGW